MIITTYKYYCIHQHTLINVQWKQMTAKPYTVAGQHYTRGHYVLSLPSISPIRKLG